MSPNIRSKKTPALFAAFVLLSTFGGSLAFAQTIMLQELRCIPNEKNAVVRATAPSEIPGDSARIYFRWKGHADFFWETMDPAGGGHYWATPPKPEKRNDSVETYATLVDGSGREIARSEMRSIPVTSDCRVDLTPKEAGFAQNLTIGETAPGQQGKDVMGFLCDGIVTRINSQGIRRADETCRACVVAWWQRKELLIPAVVGTVGVVIDQIPEPSPHRP
ncbi:MAG TPA: hypothetical protein VOA87_16255 [Thermoanaerobaculia bacterium]|nr:hypothetical protein [Thermoanaerobaculia bacterium]